MTYKPHDRATLRHALDAAAKILANGPHSGRARRDAETLLLRALRNDAAEVNLAWLIAHEGDEFSPDAAAAFQGLIERRLAGEPMQYIAGEAEFYGLPFHVNRDVLIPRPETELLVEKAIELAQRRRQSGAMPAPRMPNLRIVDVGTGSGAIAVALAHALPSVEMTATDISPAALAVARANAERNGVAGRIRFLETDLLDSAGGESFDFVLSNPPYVPDSDRATLDVEVRDYEPAQALFAGQDGMAIYRRLLPAARRALVAGGTLLVEIGHGQQAEMQTLLEREGFAAIEFFRDLQGIPRVTMALRP